MLREVKNLHTEEKVSRQETKMNTPIINFFLPRNCLSRNNPPNTHIILKQQKKYTDSKSIIINDLNLKKELGFIM